MSMSTHVSGFKPPDEKWRAMKAVWDSCNTAGVTPPDEVLKFFDHVDPDEHGVEVSEDTLSALGAVCRWRDDYRDGYEVYVEKLPPDVKVIRVFNAY